MHDNSFYKIESSLSFSLSLFFSLPYSLSLSLSLSFLLSPPSPVPSGWLVVGVVTGVTIVGGSAGVDDVSSVMRTG